MAFTETQKRDNVSTWLQYHLGHSTGYRDLSRRLQKKGPNPVPVQANDRLIAGYHSQAPLSPLGNRRSRVASGSHVISSGDFFWLHRDPPNPSGFTSSPFRKSRGNSVSGLQLRGFSSFTSGSRGCKSAGSRLLGTTRSDGNCASATHRTIRNNRKSDPNGKMAASLMVLDLGRTQSKDNVFGVSVVPRDRTRDAVTSVKRRHNDVIVDYRIDASPVCHSRDHFVTQTMSQREYRFFFESDSQSPSPTDEGTRHVTESRTNSDEETSAAADFEDTNEAASSLPKRLDRSTNDDHDPAVKVTSGTERNGSPALTVSEYFSVTLGNDGTDDRKSSSPDVASGDLVPHQLPASDLPERPVTKRSVRFSVENDVYRYSPWEPINV